MGELHEAKAAYDAALTMSEEQFVDWCDEDVRAEFVDGQVIVMSPDSLVHTRLFKFLLKVLDTFVLRRDLGEVLGPNFQIRIRAGLRRVPDLLFVSKGRLHLLQSNHLEGAPDVAFEIVSPDSVARDRREKLREYESAGVREYVIIDPQQQVVDLYRLLEGKYFKVQSDSGVLRSAIISGFWLKEELLWQEPLPDPIEVLRELGVL
jgi:Uma2 family endonuclease